MRIFSFCVLAVVLSLSGTAYGQSSWEKLIKEIEEPMMGKPPAEKGDGEASLLRMPEGFSATQSDQAEAGTDEVSVNFVTSYKCTNPDFPRCLMRMDSRGRVDVQNCKEVTKLYLRAVAAYSRCVDRRARNHARNVIDYFNCKARGRTDCPFVYGRKD